MGTFSIALYCEPLSASYYNQVDAIMANSKLGNDPEIRLKQTPQHTTLKFS
jgi:hypothetical protein